MISEDLSTFVVQNVPDRCDLKSAAIEFAARRRGLDVERVDTSTVLVHFPKAVVPFIGMNGPDSSFVGKWLSDHKSAQRVLAADSLLPVAESAAFPGNRLSRGLGYARSLDWPVVVKPNHLSRARGVTVDIRDKDRFRAAWHRAVGSYRAGEPIKSRIVLVEKHVVGSDFRLFVVDDHVVSGTQKIRANVVGDGRSSIGELIRRKNLERANNFYLRDYPVPEDPDILDVLTSSSRSLADVPATGERIILRSQCNLWAGGDSVDVTDDLDRYFIELAVKAVRAVPGLAYAGVDIIAPDVSSAPADGNSQHIVSEVEFSPAPLAHFPVEGKARDMSGSIIEHYLRNPNWQAAQQRSHIIGTMARA